MHVRDCSCAPILWFFCAALAGSRANRQITNRIFWSIFLPISGQIASPIMHRFGRCFRRLLEDQMYFAAH